MTYFHRFFRTIDGVLAQNFFKRNGLKLAFFWPKVAVFSGFVRKQNGGVPPHPLTENHSAQKRLAESGVTPPPFAEKIR